MRFVAVTPIKLNNIRTPGKNTKLFTDGTPLIHFIERTILSIPEIDSYYIYCSNPEIEKYMLEGAKFIRRDKKYDTPEADVLAMMSDFSRLVDADVYLQIHSTAPFLKADSIRKAINIMQSGEFDSVLTVKKVQEFLWTEGKPANYSVMRIPRTQDMTPWFAETTGMYVYTREVIQGLHRRVGIHPYLLEVSEIEAIDINNPIDFEIADAVYTHIVKHDKLI